MNISEAIDRAVKAKWRADLINMLTDAGHALEKTGLKVNGARYQDVPVGPLLMKAAAALEECWKREGLVEAVHNEEEFVRVNWEKLDRIANRRLWEAGANQIDSTKYGDLANCAAAPKPVTNGDRIRAMTDEELAESEELLSGLCNVLHGQGYPCEANTCRECLIKWLGSPVKEENDGQ